MIFLFLLSVVGGFARIGVAGVVFGYWTRWNSLCEHPKFCFFYRNEVLGWSQVRHG